MNTTAMSAPASAEAPHSQPEPATDAGQDPIPRRLYLTMRLEEISTLLGEMAKEREQATTDLQAPPVQGGPNLKQLRERRAYLAQRLAVVRKEKTEMIAEQKAMGVIRRGGAGFKTTQNPPRPQGSRPSVVA